MGPGPGTSAFAIDRQKHLVEDQFEQRIYSSISDPFVIDTDLVAITDSSLVLLAGTTLLPSIALLQQSHFCDQDMVSIWPCRLILKIIIF